MNTSAQDNNQSPKLFGEQTCRCVETMSFSQKELSRYPLYISAAAQVKKACAIANYRAGQMSAQTMERIIAACAMLEKGEHHDQFPVDVFHGGGCIGINMNLNEVIARLAGADIDTINDVNMSQSTSDVCQTSLRISLIRLTEKLIPVIGGLENALKAKDEEFSGIETIARTCWQDGMSIDASAVFRALSSALRRRRKKLAMVIHDELHCVNLGWTVIGTGKGATDVYRAQILKALQESTNLPLQWRGNPCDTAQYPDDLAQLSSEIRIISSLASKFAKDLRLLSSGPETGLHELELPMTQAGSSFFPGKVNPVIPEMVIQCGMLIAGNDSVIQSALDMGEIHINLWEGMMGFLLMDNVSMFTNAMHSFHKNCIQDIFINRAQCEAYAKSSIPFIVDCKEKYGYAYVSEQIKQHGVRGFINKIERSE
jgi:aspartate ammonia-lyase